MTNTLKNRINLFSMILCSLTLACCAATTKIVAMESNVETQATVGNNEQQNESQQLQAELDTITENILASFNTSQIKSNKIDAMTTSLALMMIISYAFVGCIPPHVASSSSTVHAAGSMLNQHIKNKGYSECVENLKEFKSFTQKILCEKSAELYSEKILNITKIIEKNILAKMKTNKKAFLLRIMIALPFIIGYFLFAEINAASKLYPEVFNEITNMIKSKSKNKDAKLNDEQIIQANALATIGVVAEAFLRIGYGFGYEGNYYMYPWLIGAILEIVNLHYIRCSNRNYSKIALDEVNGIRELIKQAQLNEFREKISFAS